MDPGHPRYVALWLAEVFGGPATYTEQRGGYPHMLNRHLGKAITEPQRRRCPRAAGASRRRTSPEGGPGLTA